MINLPKIVNAKSHPDFAKIEFPYNKEAILVENLSKEEIDKFYKKVKRKVFGWNIFQITSDERLNFVGDTLFSKANNTSTPLIFNHTFEVEDKVETSISVSGDLSISVNGKGSKISGGLESKIRAEIGMKKTKIISETFKTTLHIPCNHKLTISLKGNALLNNGVAKYYLFGINFKKGTWEYIDVITEYYDYYEEEI